MWMDLETEWSQKEKKKYYILIHICGIYKKWCRWSSLQSRNKRHRHREQVYGHHGQKGGVGWTGGLGLTFIHSVQSVQLLSHVQLCKPMNCSMPGFPVYHQFLELAQTHAHRVGDVIQPSHLLLFPSSTFNLSQHQGHFQWVSSLHQVARVLGFQLQLQSFQWIFRTDFL